MADVPVDIYLRLTDSNTPMEQTREKLPDFSSSNSDTETEGDPDNENESETVARSIDERKMSPPPNCAICLGRCKNKCFTDSCIHQFCFKCLCEWSKVKPECPLCKQTFKSIIHNVKSEDQFERYHVEPPTVQLPQRPLDDPYDQLPYIGDDVANGSRREYDLAIANSNGSRAHSHPAQSHGGAIPSGVGVSNNTTDGDNSISHGSAHNLLFYGRELVRLFQREYPDAPLNTELRTQQLRRYLYDRKFCALPVRDITGNFRESSARFYRSNPAQIHRLMPFISRDIMCLLRNTVHDVSLVLDLIKESLPLMNILSPSFRRRLQPFLGHRTAHFIHELHNFARSPYDMLGYDRIVQYSAHAGDDIVIGSASSDDDNVSIVDNNQAEGSVNAAVGGGAGDQLPQTSRRATEYRLSQSQGPTNRGQSSSATLHLNVMSYAINTNADGSEVSGFSMVDGNRETQPAAINLSTHNRGDDAVIVLDETDTDVLVVDPEPFAPSVNITDNIELTSGSSDECEFVLERKPPHLRTPDMISLNSDSDSDVVFVNEIQLQHHTLSNTSAEGGASETKPPMQLPSVPKQAEDTQVFNMGASTSAGIRSDRRQRWQINTRSGKHVTRSTFQAKNKRMKLINRSTTSSASDSDSSSNACTCTSDSDDNHLAASGKTMNRRYRKRQVNNNKPKRQAAKNEANRRTSLKRSSSSSETSDEDECLNLKILRSKLKMESNETGSEPQQQQEQDDNQLHYTDNSSNQLMGGPEHDLPPPNAVCSCANYSNCHQCRTQAAASAVAADDDEGRVVFGFSQQYDSLHHSDAVEPNGYQPEQQSADDSSTSTRIALEIAKTSPAMLASSPTPTTLGDASSNHAYDELDMHTLPSHSSSSGYTMYSATTSLSTNASTSPLDSQFAAITDAEATTESNDFNAAVSGGATSQHTASQYTHEHILGACILPLATDHSPETPPHPS